MAKPSYHIQLKGYVGGEDFDRKTVDEVLAKNGNSHVDVLIDSTGGSLATGMSISAAFKNHGDVAVHFVGLNASAATIASLGAKHISMDSGAMYLVHKCSVDFFKWASMNADNFANLIADATRTMEDLDKLDQNIARLYAARCKRKPEEMLALMSRGGWISAQEALEWGFIDEITDYADEPQAMLTDVLASAMSLVGMPLPNIKPVDNNGNIFDRFLNAFSSLFKFQPSSSMQTTPKTYSAEEYDALNAKFENLQKEAEEAKANAEAQAAKIAELENKLAKAPAEPSAQVIENNKHVKIDSEATGFDSFCEKVNNAAALFNQV